MGRKGVAAELALQNIYAKQDPLLQYRVQKISGFWLFMQAVYVGR